MIFYLNLSSLYRKTFLVALALVATTVLGFLPADAVPSSYSISDLGTLGGQSSESLGIAPVGLVAGKAAVSRGLNHDVHACLWKNHQPQDLATLGGRTSAAFAVNGFGQVVGVSQTAEGDQHAFLWESGSLTDLGTLGGSLSFAYGINARGQVCGCAYTILHHALSHAFLWQRGGIGSGIMMNLGTLGGNNSTALAINDFGQVAGFAYTAGGDYHAFLWQRGHMNDLGTLGGRYSMARGLSAKGLSVGNSITSAGEQHAFLYAGGRMTDLYPFSSRYSDALGINEQGQVVGFAELPDGEYRAFLYSGGTTYDLNSIISSGSGWVLQEARAINDAGQIAGVGSINGQRHAFLLTPPAADVTASVIVTRGGFRYNARTKLYSQQVAVKNTDSWSIWGPFSLVLDGLSTNATLANATGTTATSQPAGSPYMSAQVSGRSLAHGQNLIVLLQFRNLSTRPITYRLRIMAGPGTL